MFQNWNLSWRNPFIRRSKRTTIRRDRGRRFAVVERLEDRALLSVGAGEYPVPAEMSVAPRSAASHGVADHIHAYLKIIIDGQEMQIAADIGITAAGHFSPHTHDISGKLHIGEGLLAGTSQENRFVKLDDFFDVWRTTTSVSPGGTNSNANFNATQLMDRVADATRSVFMTVNGVLNTEFDNYIPHDNDRIVLSYGPADGSPSLASLPNVTLLAGSPLYVPLDGYDPNGQTLSYTVTSSNPAVSIYQPTTNRSLRINVEAFGDMLFELFDDKASRATNQFTALASSGFFSNVIFHRVIDNFVIQGGDPTGTGSGGSSRPDFDDQFDVTLQHNRTGLLSMAKSTDDTNDSQFFVTEGPQRHLDSNHTIFGLLVEGESVREAISEVATDANGRPTTSVVMNSATVIPNDAENAVVMLDAPIGTTGTSTITVTVTDPDGHRTQRTFTVTIQADTVNNPPFLADVSTVITTVNTQVSFQLAAHDAENDTNTVFLDQTTLASNGLFVPASAPSGFYSVDFITGLVTVTPPSGFVGTQRITVAAADRDRALADANNPKIDYQVVTVIVNSGPATANSAPTLDSFGSPYLTAPAGTLLPTDAKSGILVTDLIARGTSGNPISDPDAGAVEGIAVTAIDRSLGKWQYTFVSNPTETDWTDVDAGGAVSDSSALLLPADTATRLRFVTTLMPRHNDQATDGSTRGPAQGFLPLETRLDAGLTFRAWDRTAGSAGSRADTTANGGTTAFSSAAETVAVVFETRLFRSFNAAAQLNVYTLEQEFHALVNVFGYQDRSTSGFYGFTVFMSRVPGLSMSPLYRMYYGIQFNPDGTQTDMGYRYLTTDLNEAQFLETLGPADRRAQRDGCYFREIGVNSGTAILAYIYTTSQPGTVAMSQIYRTDLFPKDTRTGPPGTPATGSVMQEQGDHVYTTRSAIEMAMPGTWRQESTRGFVRELAPGSGGSQQAARRASATGTASLNSTTASDAIVTQFDSLENRLAGLAGQLVTPVAREPAPSAPGDRRGLPRPENAFGPPADRNDTGHDLTPDARAFDAHWSAASHDILIDWDAFCDTASG